MHGPINYQITPKVNNINNHNNDLIIFYDLILFPNIPFDIVFTAYNPKKKGTVRFNITCPSCHQDEACVWTNTGIIQCNRKDKCKYESNILKFLNNGKQPLGQDFIKVIKQLCEVSGIEFPEREYTSQEVTAFTKRDHKKELFDNFKSITMHALFSEEGKEALEYWQLRGLSIQDITKFSLGAYPSSKLIEQELLKKNYLPSDIKESGLCRSDWDGRIIIPIKSNGIIGDFIAGDIKREDKNIKKYLRMNGECAFDNSMLLGLDKAGNDITIVEGPFDYFNLTIAGFENIVALGGCQIWDSHIPTLLKHKVKIITLLLDDDKAGSAAILNNIDKLKNEDFEVFVVDQKFLNKMDPDKFIQTYGPEKLDENLQQRIHGFEYFAQSILEKHSKNGEFNTYAKNNIIDEALSFEATISNRARSLATEEFWKNINKEADISKETIAQHRVEIQEKKAQEKRSNSIEQIRKQIDTAISSGNEKKASSLVNELSNILKCHSNIPDQNISLVGYNSETRMIAEFQKQIPNIETGYTIGEIPLAFPAGGISLILGPTGHGKTTALINFSLGVIKKNPNASVYYLTYEENWNKIEVKFLNTYFNKPLNSGNNKGAIIHYFHAIGNPTDDPYKFINENKDEFIKAKDEFFEQIIDKQKLIMVRLDSTKDNLITLVKSIKENDKNVGLIIIDYVQLLYLEDKKANGGRHEELKEICKDINDCAIETGLPIVLGAQFTRNVKSESELSQFEIAEAHDIARYAANIYGLWNRTHDIPAVKEVYFKVLKGRDIGIGHETVMNFDGNTGKLSQYDDNTARPASEKKEKLWNDSQKQLPSGQKRLLKDIK